MNMPRQHVESVSIVSNEEHRKWMAYIRLEFKLLIAQQDIDSSPCTSMRKSRRIWVTEQGRAPLLERQNGFNRTVNLNCEVEL